MKKNLLKSIKTSTVTLALFILCHNAFAQTAPTSAGIVGVTTHIDKFFKNYENNGSAKAVITLFKTNPLIDSASLTTLIGKIDTTRIYAGQYYGKELIVQRKASNSLVLYSYLVKHQKHALRFTFMFYKPKNDWEIYRLYFDDQVDNELAESAKLTAKP